MAGFCANVRASVIEKYVAGDGPGPGLYTTRTLHDDLESSKPRATSPLSTLNPSGKQLIGYWCWLCFVLDIVMPLLAYFLQRLPKTNPSQTFGYEGITSCESSSSRATPNPCETKLPNAPPPPQP